MNGQNRRVEKKGDDGRKWMVYIALCCREDTEREGKERENGKVTEREASSSDRDMKGRETLTKTIFC